MRRTVCGHGPARGVSVSLAPGILASRKDFSGLPCRTPQALAISAVLGVAIAVLGCQKSGALGSSTQTPTGTARVGASPPVHSAPAGASADANTLGGCNICHADMAAALTGTTHAANGIGCVTCHGASQGHVEDENNHVKPDVVFAKKDIDPFCGKCHGCSRPGAARPAAKVCSECHSAHRIAIAAR